MQDAEVDAVKKEAHAHIVRMGEAIMRELGGRRLADVARAAGYPGGQLSRMVNGHHVSIKTEQVRALEVALQLEPGFLFRAAGYVEEADSVEEMILKDPRIPDARTRSLLSSQYRLAVESFSAAKAKPSTRNRARS